MALVMLSRFLGVAPAFSVAWKPGRQLECVKLAHSRGATSKRSKKINFCREKELLG
jgi:hypothetical protein